MEIRLNQLHKCALSACYSLGTVLGSGNSKICKVGVLFPGVYNLGRERTTNSFKGKEASAETGKVKKGLEEWVALNDNLESVAGGQNTSVINLFNCIFCCSILKIFPRTIFKFPRCSKGLQFYNAGKNTYLLTIKIRGETKRFFFCHVLFLSSLLGWCSGKESARQ